MVKGHRIERKIRVNKFLETIKNYSEENIICTKHTFFRLSGEQRKIFKCNDIKDYLLEKDPYFAGIQYNRCYAVFYKYKEKEFIRIILDIKPNDVEIVTFYVIDLSQIPKIK